MSKTIIVDVSGEGAFERAKDRIAAQTEDVDSRQVTAVYAEITIEETQDELEEMAERVPGVRPADSDADGPTSSFFDEDDRQLGECSRGSQHEAMTIVSRLEAAGDDHIDSNTVGGHVVDASPGSMSGALGKLYQKRLVDREKWTGATESGAGTMKFLYSVTEHGRSEIRRLGEYEPKDPSENPDSVLVDG